jgi:hypothetical protein
MRRVEGRWIALEGDARSPCEWGLTCHRLRVVVAWQGELLYEDDGTARPSDPPTQIASILALLLVRHPHATPRHASLGH